MTTAAPDRVRYRDVLGDREYRAVFVADGLSVVGDQVTRLAVALVVFERTGSAFLASVTWALAFLAWLLGGPALSSLADRWPRRTLMLSCDLARAGLVLLLALAPLPVPALFAVLLLVGLLAPPFDAARSALLADVLEGERFVVGNALSGAVAQGGQVVGFLVGGTLVHLLGTRTALLLDAGTFVLSAALIAVAVRHRAAAAGDAAGSPADLLGGLRLVAGSPVLRGLLGWAVLVGAVSVPAEGLAVVVAADAGGGARAAGLLTAAVPAGYLIGSWLVLRLPAARRTAVFPVLTLLTCAALLLTPVVGALPAVLALWVVAGTGTAVALVANAAFVQAVPPQLRGRAFGIAATVLMAVQGLVLVGAGAVAEAVGGRTAVAGTAAAGLLVLLAAAVLGRPRLQGTA